VASFLRSRGIKLPYGDPSDPPDKETICGLGNRKNYLFNQLITQEEIEVFSTTVNLIKELKKADIRVGVASSSKNAKNVMDSAGLSHLFETRVDGVVSAELNLKGKPEPDIFTTACKNLAVPYDRTVIVEDAVSGVQAGANGNFGLVLGVAREENDLELLLNGADIVVKDLGEIDIQTLEKWFTEGIEDSKWSLQFYDYSQADEGTREVLCAIGNGYFGTRGAMEETRSNDTNYPGTYIAGVYNRLESSISGRTIVNEDFVNCPNWLPITFKIEDGDWFNPNDVEILQFNRSLDFRTGMLSRKMLVRDQGGRETLIESKRLASMAEPHLAGLQYTIRPQNYSGRIAIRSGLNGRISNAGVKRYSQLSSTHLVPMIEGNQEDLIYLLVRTNQSAIQIAEAAKHLIYVNDELIDPEISIETTAGAIFTTFNLEAKKETKIRVEKMVTIYTSKDNDIENNPQDIAIEALKKITGFDPVKNSSLSVWSKIWEQIDIKIDGDRLAQKLLRMNQYHSMVTASHHNANIDAGIPARGLHGEAYRGHIFWDEMYILPFYTLHFPKTAQSALLYRYRRLNRAREYARSHGYKGAMYPWQSGSDGREETQVIHLNPMSGEWGPDHSSLQRHVSLAIAYNIWYYGWITRDIEFLSRFGAEIFLEICRFWASKTRFNLDTRRYEIDKVMGPDEFHEKYPYAEDGGLKDNSYTNVMVAWTLNKAFILLDLLDEPSRIRIREKINLMEEELAKWKDIATKIHIPMSEDYIIEQFEGYFDLEELDWDHYTSNYVNISRMDRILKAEGKSPDQYKVAKQADTLMIFYNLNLNEIKQIIKGAGYDWRDDILERNFHYYYPRTSHGSTLSKLVHAHLANKIGDMDLSMKLYKDTLISDYADVQVGTTREGIHVGVMCGTAVLVLKSYAGVDLSGEIVRFNPRLPNDWRKICFNFEFSGEQYQCKITPNDLSVKVESENKKEIKLFVHDKKMTLKPMKWITFKLNNA
jgi:HAD superfamily hydrolase (TIGR01509 family)